VALSHPTAYSLESGPGDSQICSASGIAYSHHLRSSQKSSRRIRALSLEDILEASHGYVAKRSCESARGERPFRDAGGPFV